MFEIAIIEKPTKKAAEDGAGERLVFGPKTVVANDAQSAAIAAVMDEKNAITVDRSRMEVLVRPFVLGTQWIPATSLGNTWDGLTTTTGTNIYASTPTSCVSFLGADLGIK